MSGSAARMRECRARRKAGRVIVRIEIDDVATPQALVDGGYLSPHDTEDLDRVARALERAVADFRAAMIE